MAAETQSETWGQVLSSDADYTPNMPLQITVYRVSPLKAIFYKAVTS